MNNFFLVANSGKENSAFVAEQIASYIRSRGARCRVCEKADEQPPADAECILVLGGDGTMLQAAYQYSQCSIPFMGINLGTLGYLTEAEASGWKEAVDRLLYDRFDIDDRMMLKGEIYDRSGRLLENMDEKESYALNDIAITRAGSLQIVTYRIFVNDLFLGEYHADGILVCTPTGSTGYNLSAGGPIVEPPARLLLLTPICPHKLNNRSIVLSAEDRVRIEIGDSGKQGKNFVEADFDGGDRAKFLDAGYSVVICAAERTTRFIRLSSTGFLEILHKKMGDMV